MAMTLMSPVYLDLVPDMVMSNNFVDLPFDNMTRTFQRPATFNSSSNVGIDWTQPYPGSSLDGFQTHLTVAFDVPVPETLAQNATTALTSLTFSIPENLYSEDKSGPKPLDKSWYVCRHIFISTERTAREGVADGKGCGFLPDQCKEDLRDAMTKNWGQDAENNFMCSGYAMDPIPQSCRESTGFLRQDVIGFDGYVLKDETQWKALVQPDQSQYSWRIGTGYHHPQDVVAQEAALNRTYIVGTVYGYNKGVIPMQNASLTFSLQCLSPWSKSHPQPVTSNATSSHDPASPTQSSSATRRGLFG